MQKRNLMMITLILTALLLTGCLGRTSTKYVYDGSPTALEVVIKRNAVGPMALSSESEQYVRVQLWMDNEAGETIYQTSETIPLAEVAGEGYTLAREVPADKGYSVLAIYSDNQGYFEVAQQTQINAPAEKVTTANVGMVPVEYEIVIPEAMYSGGTMNQFKIIFPKEYEYLFDYGIYFRSWSWDVNGAPSLGNYSRPETPKNVTQVFEPREYYYQFVVHVNHDVVGNPSVGLRAYIPNLDYEVVLPTFLVYPHPGWEE